MEYLLIKYRPGKTGRAALIRLVGDCQDFQSTTHLLQKCGALVHEDILNVAAMTISALKARFANYAVSCHPVTALSEINEMG